MSSRFPSPSPGRAALAVAVAVALSACGVTGASQPAAPDDRLEVVVTTTILGDLVAAIVGDEGDVSVLMEPGQDPHAFAPSARQAAELRAADLVVASGLGLEEALTDLLASVEEDGVAVFRVAERLDPVEYEARHGDEGGDEHSDGDHGDGEGDDAHDDDGGEDEAHHADDGHDHGPLDPHVHLDPVRMARAAELLAARIAEVADAESDVDWAARGATLAAEITAAHEDAASLLDGVPAGCRTIVTNHESLHYFAERYGFEVAGAVVPGGSTQAEPSARDFAELVETIRDTGAPAIVAETTQSTRLAETLAGEVGREIAVVTLFTDALGEPGSGAERYVDLVRTNAQRLADALAGC